MLLRDRIPAILALSMVAVLLACSIPLAAPGGGGDAGMARTSTGINVDMYIDPPGSDPVESALKEERQRAVMMEKIALIDGFITALGDMARSALPMMAPSEDALVIDGEYVVDSPGMDPGCDLVLRDGASIVFADGCNLSMDGCSVFVEGEADFSDGTEILFENGAALCIGGIILVQSVGSVPYRLIADAFIAGFSYYYDIMARSGNELVIELNLDILGDDSDSRIYGSIASGAASDGAEVVSVVNNTGGREIDLSIDVGLDYLAGYLRTLDTGPDTLVSDMVDFIMSKDTALGEMDISLTVTDACLPLRINHDDAAGGGIASADAVGRIDIRDLELEISKYDEPHGLTLYAYASGLDLEVAGRGYLSYDDAQPHDDDDWALEASLSDLAVIVAPGPKFDLIVETGRCNVSYSDGDAELGFEAGSIDVEFEAPGEELKALARGILYEESIDAAGFFGIFAGMRLDAEVDDLGFAFEKDVPASADSPRDYHRTVVSAGGASEIHLDASRGLSLLVTLPDTSVDVSRISGDEVVDHSITIEGFGFHGFLESDSSLVEHLVTILAGAPTPRPDITGMGLSIEGTFEAEASSCRLRDGLGASHAPGSEIAEGDCVNRRLISIRLAGVDAEQGDDLSISIPELSLGIDMGGIAEDLVAVDLDLTRLNIVLEASDILEMDVFDMEHMIEILMEGADAELVVGFDECIFHMEVASLGMDFTVDIGDGDSYSGGYVSIGSRFRVELVSPEPLEGIGIPPIDIRGSSLSLETDGPLFLTAVYDYEGYRHETRVEDVSMMAPVVFDHEILMANMASLARSIGELGALFDGITDPGQLEGLFSFDGPVIGLLSSILDESGLFFDESALMEVGSIETVRTLIGVPSSATEYRWEDCSLPFSFDGFETFLMNVIALGTTPQGDAEYGSFTMAPPASYGSAIPAEMVTSCKPTIESGSAVLELRSGDVGIRLPSEAISKLASNGDGTYRGIDIRASVSEGLPDDVRARMNDATAERVLCVLSVEAVGAASTSGLGPVTISFPLPDWVDTGEDCCVYYVSEGGGVERLPTTIVENGDGTATAVFTTDHFSGFALMSESGGFSDPEPGLPVYGAAIFAAAAALLMLVLMRRRI